MPGVEARICTRTALVMQAGERMGGCTEKASGRAPSSANGGVQ